MATYYFINTVMFKTVKHFPGSLFDDTVRDKASYDALGAVFFPTGDATVAAAAALVTLAHKNKAMDEFQMERYMVAAAAKSLKASVDADDTNAGVTTLVSGVSPAVLVTGMTATSKVTITVKTPGGTMGNNYKAVPGAGSFVITAIDTAGATVTTDTSTLMWVAVP